MRYAPGFLFFFLTSLLYAQVSDLPEVQELVDQGLGRIEAGQYVEALRLFQQAEALDGENDTIKSYIVSLNRMITLDDYQADQESIDRFIEEREALKEEEQETPVEEEGNVDFITQEQNKEKAREERALGGITLRFPFLNSSNGDSSVDSDLRRAGEVFQGVSYGLSYFPNLLNRTIGVEGGSGSFSLVIDEQLIIYDEVMMGFVLRNYFNEQPGTYSLLGTHFNVGLLFKENVDAEMRSLQNFFRFEVFFRDPLFYRLLKSRPLRAVALDGTFQFTLLDDTYMLGYGGGLTLSMGSRLDFTGNFLFRNYMINDTAYPSWTVYAGAVYSFR